MLPGSRPWWLRVGGLAPGSGLASPAGGLAWLGLAPPERGFLEFLDFLGNPIRAILASLAIRVIIARHTHL